MSYCKKWNWCRLWFFTRNISLIVEEIAGLLLNTLSREGSLSYFKETVSKRRAWARVRHARQTREQIDSLSNLSRYVSNEASRGCTIQSIMSSQTSIGSEDVLVNCNICIRRINLINGNDVLDARPLIQSDNAPPLRCLDNWGILRLFARHASPA